MTQADQILTDYEIRLEQVRPSVLFRPNLEYSSCDLVERWVAWYGQDRWTAQVRGKGLTPDEAMRDFDKAWKEQDPR